MPGRPPLRFPPLIEATLLRRDNRFRATALVGDCEVAAHVANSGRLRELLRPGAKVWICAMAREGRRTAYDLVLVQHNQGLVSVDARVPNRLFEEALAARLAPGATVQREQRRGASRLDFMLQGEEGPLWVEVKSVTLVREGLALFPDAPTLRGARHIRELEQAVAEGDRASVVFMVQREDATAFAPNAAADPALALAIAHAVAAGVNARAFRCRVSLDEIVALDEIPVLLGG